MDDNEIMLARNAAYERMMAWAAEARTQWPFLRHAPECAAGWIPRCAVLNAWRNEASRSLSRTFTTRGATTSAEA